MSNSTKLFYNNQRRREILLAENSSKNIWEKEWNKVQNHQPNVLMKRHIFVSYTHPIFCKESSVRIKKKKASSKIQVLINVRKQLKIPKPLLAIN